MSIQMVCGKFSGGNLRGKFCKLFVGRILNKLLGTFGECKGESIDKGGKTWSIESYDEFYILRKSKFCNNFFLILNKA